MVYRCQNEGKISGGTIPGMSGIINCTRSTNRSTFEINSCLNKGRIFNTSGYVAAGIVYCYLATDYNNIRVTNCLNLGDMGSPGGGISNVELLSIKNCISICKYSNVETKVFYGDDFSAFNHNRKAGKIGLNAFESVGQWQNKVTEEYLSSNNFSKIA